MEERKSFVLWDPKTGLFLQEFKIRLVLKYGPLKTAARYSRRTARMMRGRAYHNLIVRHEKSFPSYFITPKEKERKEMMDKNKFKNLSWQKAIDMVENYELEQYFR